MSFSATRGFDPLKLFGWIRSEANERYLSLTSTIPADPWFGADPLYLTALAGAAAEVPA